MAIPCKFSRRGTRIRVSRLQLTGSDCAASVANDPPFQVIPFDPSSEEEGPEAIKNSQVHQQSSDLSPKRKRKRLVKESHLPHLPRGKSSSRVPSEGICAVASKGKGGLSVSASLSSRALVAHESGITYQLNEESTPASIKSHLVLFCIFFKLYPLYFYYQ